MLSSCIKTTKLGKKVVIIFIFTFVSVNKSVIEIIFCRFKQSVLLCFEKRNENNMILIDLFGAAIDQSLALKEHTSS